MDLNWFRTGFVISDALGLGCRRREAHDPTLLTLYGVKYGVKIPHLNRRAQHLRSFVQSPILPERDPSNQS
jgi:hypothetical protein